MKEDQSIDIGNIAKFEVFMTKLRYDNELAREESIIKQAGNMQSAFAFSTAALFMAVPVMFQQRGVLSFNYIFGGTAILTGILMFSLFSATMAQNRNERYEFPECKEIIEYIENNEKKFSDEITRDLYIADSYKEIQESLCTTNNNRVKWVNFSMWSFYSALGFCAIWFVISLIIMYRR